MTEHDPQMLKGVLSMLLLHLVHQQEDYGYSLAVRLQDSGFPGLAEGTVYPALSRLESQDMLESRLVRSTGGPARKYYALTAAGDAELARSRQSWTALVDAVSAIVTDSPEPAVRTRERTAR